MNNTSKKHDYSIDNIKALMLLGIFLSHGTSTSFTIPNLYTAFSSSLTLSLGAFFMISGYFTKTANDNLSTYFDLLIKRFKTLLVPYFLWNILYISFFLIGALFLPVMQARVKVLELNSLWGIINGLVGLTHHPADGPLWYIRNLYLCILCYPALRFLCKHKILGLIFIGSQAILLSILVPYMHEYVFIYFKPYISTSFCLGIYFRENNISLHAFDKLHFFVGVTFILAIIGIYNIVTITPLQWLFERRLGGYLLLIPFWLYIARFFTYSQNSILGEILTKPAFFVYASHAFCGSFFQRVLFPYIPENQYKWLILIAIYFIGGSMLVYSMYFFLKRFFPKVLSLLTGSH